MRLRTLPLSLSGVVVGIALGKEICELKPVVVITLIVTTALLQILSNLSNELGDTLSGTDTEGRQGVHYSIQDGEMTIPQMKKFIAVIAVLCCISGLGMVLFSFGTFFEFAPAALLVLGAAAIWSAMHYTLGKNPYGYRGLGDLFVFVFFGIVAVAGAAYVCSHSFRAEWLLPGSAFGLWSIGVLNVNNIRDMKTDAATRTTVALKLGLRKARIYHAALICGGWVLMLVWNLITACNWSEWLFFVTLPLFALHLRGVFTRTERSLDPMLPMLVMTTFITALLLALFM